MTKGGWIMVKKLFGVLFVIVVLVMATNAFCRDAMKVGIASDVIRMNDASLTSKGTRSTSYPYIIAVYMSGDNQCQSISKFLPASGNVYYCIKYLAGASGYGTMYFFISDSLGSIYYFNTYQSYDVANTTYTYKLTPSLYTGDYKLQAVYQDSAGHIAISSDPFTFELY
jgi:hypothetical protein